MNQTNQEQQVNSDEYSYQPLSVVDLLGILFREKIVVIASTLLGSILAITYALNAPLIYRSELLMVSATGGDSSLASLAGQFGGLASMAGVSLGGDNTSTGETEKNLAILTSRTFTGTYLNENNLLPVLFAEDWDEKNNEWKDGGEPPSVMTAYVTASKMLSLNIDPTTGLIKFGIEFTDPQFAATYANGMIARLNEYIRNQVIDETQENIKYLEEQIQKTSFVNAQGVLYGLIEEQTKNIMLASVREEYAFQVIDPAVVPELRIRPKRRSIVVTGFIMGLMGGLVLVFLKEFYVSIKNTSNTA